MINFEKEITIERLEERLEMIVNSKKCIDSLKPTPTIPSDTIIKKPINY